MLQQLHQGIDTKGERVAQLRVTLDHIAGLFGYEVETGADDLDTFRHVLLRASETSPAFRLLAYDHDPDTSVLVIGPITKTLEDDLDELVHELRLSDADIVGRAFTPRPGSPIDFDPTDLPGSTSSCVCREGDRLVPSRSPTHRVSRHGEDPLRFVG